MRFVYYTDKTVAQCMLALNERLQTKASRTVLEGWVEKSGNFSIATTSNVFRRFPRTTRLQGKVTRESGLTTVKGGVSDGVTPRDMLVILLALGLLAAFVIARGNLLPGVVVIIAGLVVTIPLAGDHQNSKILISEVQRTLKARETPPVIVKRAAEPKKTSPAAKKPPTLKTSTPKKTTIPTATRVSPGGPAKPRL